VFAVLRILFILVVLGLSYSAIRYVKSRDRYWLKIIRWIVYFVLFLSFIIFTGLVIQRVLMA